MFLYILYSTKDFKIKYVGITIRKLNLRLNNHIRDSKQLLSYNHKWINNQIVNGFEIRIKTIKKFDKLEDLKLGEIFLIKYLRDKGYKLTNSSDGGDGVLNPSQENRDKKRVMMANRIVSNETKQKLSITHTGKKMPQSFIDKMKLKTAFSVDCNIPILEYDLFGNLIQRWEGIRVAAKYYNISDTAIINNLKGRSKTSNKRIWKYEK
jgi:hypothetical protein